MGNSASSEQQQQEEITNQNAYSNTNNNYTTSNTKSIKINQPKVSEDQALDKTTPSISYSSPLSPPIPGMMQQAINNNNDNNNDNNDNNQDNNIINDNNNSATETTTNTNNNNNTNINNTGNANSNPTSTTASDTTTLPKPVPGRSGWVSSTGASSPWYGGGSLSSSASSTHPQPYGSSYQQQQVKSSHRQSISGPYYRARGMSINQQQEPNEDDLNNNNNNNQQQQQQLLQPSPSTSTSQQLPRLQLQQLQINSPSLSSPLSTAKPESLPKEKSTPGIPTIITWSHGGNNVYVTGTFNGWKHKIPLVKSTHDFSTVIDLPLGTNRLKFIVDDEWKCSNEMETATDPDGNLVNYLQVLDEDDVEDDSDIFRKEGNDDNNNVNKDGDDDDDVQYTNVIPEELTLLAEAIQTAATDPHSMDQQKRDAIEWERKQPQPPTLPPHLEKVLLNSQNVSEEDNSILPTPNHVTLNHLYACSIKDQVMALSTTTRYRKKYVTTMYYRPVQQ